MNIKSTNEQLLGNYGAYKNNQLEQSNTIKNSDNVEITKDKIVSKKDSNDNYLKLGDNGREISQLQTLLKNSGYLKSAVNGYYGKETEDAVKSFQKSRGLKETGVIDLTTKVAIAESRDVAKSVAYSTVAEAPMRRAKRSVDLTAGIGLAGVGASTAGVAAGGVAATGGVASSWNENVYYLQVLCNQYGVSVDTDGIWGKNTESAVKQLPQLSYGSNEGAVYHIQNVLKIPADGKFGSATKAAVENWQRQHGLTADGIVGADTWISFSGFKPIGNSFIDAAIQLGGVGAPSSSALKLDVSSEQATQWLQILCNQMGIRDNSGNLLPQNGEMTWGTVEAMNKLPMLSTSTGNSYLGAVKHIQNLLKINADGYYGSDTAKAVRFWQTAHGISSDGIVGHDTWETFAGQKFIAKKPSSTLPVIKPQPQDEELLAYQKDIINMKNSDNVIEGGKHFAKYLWDRFPGLWGELNEQNALNMGMEPEYAKLAGEMSEGLFLEGFATVVVDGARAYKNIKTGEIIFDSNVIAGSGLGNLARSFENKTTKSFWKAYEDLPKDIKKLADTAFEKFKANPGSPGLKFEQLEGGKFYSVRINDKYRAYGRKVPDGGIEWVEINGHDYKKAIRMLENMQYI